MGRKGGKTWYRECDDRQGIGWLGRKERMGERRGRMGAKEWGS